MRFKSQKLFLDSESEAVKAATSLLRGCALDRYLKKRYNAHSDDEAIEAVPEFLIVGNGCEAFLQVPVKGGGRCQYINTKATKHYKIRKKSADETTICSPRDKWNLVLQNPIPVVSDRILFFILANA